MLLGGFSGVVFYIAVVVGLPLLSPRDASMLSQDALQNILVKLRSTGTLDAFTPDSKAGFEAAFLQSVQKGSDAACGISPNAPLHHDRRGLLDSAAPRVDQYQPAPKKQNAPLSRRTEEASGTPEEETGSKPGNEEAFDEGYKEGFDNGYKEGYQKGEYFGLMYGMCMEKKKCQYKRLHGETAPVGPDLINKWGDECLVEMDRLELELGWQLSQLREDKDENMNAFESNAKDLVTHMLGPLAGVSAAAGSIIRYGSSHYAELAI